MAISFNPALDYNTIPYTRAYGMPSAGRVTSGMPGMSPAGEVTPGMPQVGRVASGEEVVNRALGRTEEKGECQTCKNRKYVDGSDEGNVSFKAPGHISPEASAGMVMAHEQEHVANAVREGNQAGNELVSVSVSLKTAVCPECGRTYVAGGTTRTMIRYGDTPYEKNRKSVDYARFAGANIDMKG